MDAALKERIFKRFLTETSLISPELSLHDLDQVKNFYNLLEFIEIHHGGLFNFLTIENNDAQWSELKKIIDYSCTFSSHIPTQIEVNYTKANESIRYYQNAHVIAALPKDDYFNRRIQKLELGDDELQQKILKSRTKLYHLTQTFPGSCVFDPSDVKEVANQISVMRSLLKSLPEESPQKLVLEKRLHILKDLNKFNQLEYLSIPQDKGPALDYCVLPKTISGSTEKKSLLRLETLRLQINRLCADESLTVDSYNTNRKNYKLSTEAIIKLPKYGAIEEVQHEAMALNISRLMGLETTRCTTVSYNNRPALFVPFDQIQLLQEFTKGKTFNAGWGFQGQTYTHYSTIKPVGEGLQADQFIEDFGNSLPLFYVCSDTDAVGGYCQNKALKNSKTLFIFDQVIMTTDKFALDSRLSLQPNQFLMKHTRHGIGRNRTLIEDSSLLRKYQSLMQLRELRDIILQYLAQTSKEHRCRVAAINQQLKIERNSEESNRLGAELNDVLALEQDAELIKKTIEQRIAAISGILPKTNGAISAEEVNQALILEKLMNNPVLFSDDGRPYKNPWTSRHTNQVHLIENIGSGNILIHFKHHLTAELTNFIKRHGVNFIVLPSTKVIQISKDNLRNLKEDSIYPEHQLTFSLDTKFLSSEDLNCIKKAYGHSNSTEILACINAYQSQMTRSSSLINVRLECIINTQALIMKHINSAEDKGFGKHILKKFHFDAQQQMQKMMGEHTPAQLCPAFLAAIKLDRMSEFNNVVLEALAQKKVFDPQFIEFLNFCIQKVSQATNYNEAVQVSMELSQEADRVLAYLNKGKIPIFAQLDRYARELPQKEQWVDPEETIVPENDDLRELPINLSASSSIYLEEGWVSLNPN